MSAKAGPADGPARRGNLQVLLVSFVLMGISGLVWIAFPVFLVAMESDLGWSRSALTTGFSLFALANAVTAPFVGWAMARFDSRLVLAGLAGVLALGLAGASQSGTALAFWFWFGLVGGLGVNCFSSSSLFVLLASQFPARPASAMAFADAASGMAVFLGSPLLRILIDTVGWRQSYLVLAGLAGVLGIGLHLFMLNPIPRDRIGRAAVPGAGFVRRIDTRLAILAASFLCGSAVLHGVQTQQVALFLDRGVSAETAVWILAWTGLATFVWRIASGLLADRIGILSTAAFTVVGGVATFVLLANFVLGTPGGLLFIFPFVMSLGFGGQAVLLAAAARQIVPIARFSVALGFMRLGAGLGMAGGPVISALAHDISASYLPAVAILGVVAALHFGSIWAAMLARKP